MPTASETARAEVQRWEELASHWTPASAPDLWETRPPIEREVVVFHDPTDDLHRRGRDWNHKFPEHDLSSVAVFAAGLARAEADAWESDSPDVATRAYEERRFLLGDRVIHWVVPWLEAVRLQYEGYAPTAESDRDFLLDLGDEMRVAPQLPGSEGLVLDGHDSFGPIEHDHEHHRHLHSLWSGALVIHLHEGVDLARYYADSALRWEALALTRTGSAQLWTDLAQRAVNTAIRLD